MKKILLGLFIGMAMLCSILMLRAKPSTKTIAMVTTLSHPALDSVQAGFVKALGEKMGDDIALLSYNAEGNVQQANLIAQKIASDKGVIGILTIGSLATMAVAKAEKKRPIIFTAVSDPKVLGDIGDNVCGLSDAIAPAFQVDAIKKLMPGIKRAALLYTPSEANSASMVAGLADALSLQGLASTLVGIHEPQQIMTASAAACSNADAVIIPLDNQLVASMPTVIKATRALPCLIIASNESPIHQGATIAFGIDYPQSGSDAATIMAEIVGEKTEPRRVGIINPRRLDLFINDRVVKEKQAAIEHDSLPNVIHVAGDIHG
jgi:putative ABC transport system substrate-binding protein